ncbi:hypothetical protein OCO_15610 [Mycobacterium intracellulare MOTT-02]|nr:hypothetical protein [Mycobacterium intracellulare]AFC47924.1 hypothetical protein OCO_15610 [Mycobacterium intracellulare MOTT-02]MDM3896667.1 hypothetical protein [Mycobacterium intracellulare]
MTVVLPAQELNPMWARSQPQSVRVQGDIGAASSPSMPQQKSSGSGVSGL